tara:strand:+ start:424 stop:1104 length:681 start_codon:yes stop_codon:yes gene_type:complete
MIHYHCADINPHHKLTEMAGRHLLCSFAYKAPVALAHQIAQSVLLDNGAYTAWTRGQEPKWGKFYDWCDVWLDCPTTWAIIPDVIDGGVEIQDKLMSEWPFTEARGAPVWHLDEPIDRLIRLVEAWPRVCLGSAGEYAEIGTNSWHSRMIEVFNSVSSRQWRMPYLHGLRMQGVGNLFPFASVDSSDIARHQSRPQNSIPGMAERWDRVQPGFKWKKRAEQTQLFK